MSTEPGLLPERAVLVHVGPYKTGTTALQTSLHAHRAELAAAGVTYPGTHHRQMRPSWALLGRSRLGNAVVPMAEWDELVAETRAAPGRVMISSEDFSSAEPTDAAKLVADLGSERVHVLLVARRLDRLLPSSWQERVKSVNETRSYEAWLREVLTVPDSPAAQMFWRHQSVAAQLALWTSAVPASRVVLVVADEQDHALLRRLTERLLGLGPGSLTQSASPNTSLSWNRAELVRRVNAGFADGEWGERLHRRLVYAGLVSGLQHRPPDPAESSIPPIPGWALDRLRELGEERVREAASAPVQVVGDPERLRLPADVAPSAEPAPTSLAMESAVAGLAGLLDAVALRQARRRS